VPQKNIFMKKESDEANFYANNIKYLNVGVIGQGYVGANLADNLEKRLKLNIVRYGLEPQFRKNKRALKRCDLVFICVPTPTCYGKFVGDAVKSALALISAEATVIIKSTVPPGFVSSLGRENIVYVPEFLDVATAKADTDNPSRNIIGVASPSDPQSTQLAMLVNSLLPAAPETILCSWDEAAFIKYGANAFFMLKNVFFNSLYDMSVEAQLNFDVIRRGIAQDPRIGETHTRPQDKGGRGAGGACLPKDFRVFREIADECLDKFDPIQSILYNAERRNRKLLDVSAKDRALVKLIWNA
jgi:UDPglucose 6-dehydrogenase